MKICYNGKTTVHLSNFFDINGQDYSLVNYQTMKKSDTADYSVFWNEDKRIEKILLLMIWHNYDNQIQDMIPWLQDPRVHIITNAIDESVSHNRLHFCDYLFNRTKAYHQGFEFSKPEKRWYYTNEINYQNTLIETPEDKTRIFVSPTRNIIKSDKHTFRTELLNHLKKYQKLGYIGDPENNQILFSNSEFPLDTNLKTFNLSNIKHTVTNIGYSPPHVAYYHNTFISIFGETIEFGSTVAVTEKTFVPLIQGHFILPYSTSGYIKRLRDIGVRLPDFIDYSYDSVYNDTKRKEAYFQEIDRLMSKSLSEWRNHWNDNRQILEDNQSWFLQDFSKIDLTNI